MSYVDEDGEEYIAPCYNCQRKIPPDDDCYVYAYRMPHAFNRKRRGPDIFCDHDCAHDSGYYEVSEE